MSVCIKVCVCVVCVCELSVHVIECEWVCALCSACTMCVECMYVGVTCVYI